MRVIVGLGNPGAEYLMTRHNAGQRLVDEIYHKQFALNKDSYGWRRKKEVFVAEFPGLTLVKSAGIFMNESGRMVRELVQNGWLRTPSPRQGGVSPSLIKEGANQLEDLFLAHDDLDIKLGEYKIQFARGPKDHGGINSIEAALKTDQFWRIRVGVESRRPACRTGRAEERESIRGEQFVLQRFTPEEREILDGVIKKIADEIN